MNLCCSSRSYANSWIYVEIILSIQRNFWSESGLKWRFPSLKKHMLILSIEVWNRSRRVHFWTRSILMEHQQKEIYEKKYVVMEQDRWPDRRPSNISLKFLKFESVLTRIREINANYFLRTACSNNSIHHNWKCVAKQPNVSRFGILTYVISVIALSCQSTYFLEYTKSISKFAHIWASPLSKGTRSNNI